MDHGRSVAVTGYSEGVGNGFVIATAGFAGLPYTGAETYGWESPACEQVVGEYAANHGCKSTPTVVDLLDIDPTDGTTVQLLTHGKCGTCLDSAGNPHQAEALLYRVVNGGHNWPSDFHWVHERNLSVTGDINASEEIWNSSADTW